MQGEVKVAREYIEAEGLDPITVFWEDFAAGKGAVTVICYHSAWNCYFGAMGDCTIRQFFSEVGTDYLVNKLGITEWLKKSKTHEKYLCRIIDAVRMHARNVVAA